MEKSLNHNMPNDFYKEETAKTPIEHKIKYFSLALPSLIAIFSTFTICYGFYYETITGLNQNEADIKEIKDEVRQISNKMNDVAVYKGISESKINELQLKVEKMDIKLDQIIILTSK